MIYLLDTNTCITYLKVPTSPIRTRLAALQPGDVVVCSVVKAELHHGALRSRDPARALSVQQTFLGQFQSLPLDDVAAEVAGRIRADLEAKGTPIGPYDVLIAAIALANDLVLVTHNTREFARVTGLKLEDWEANS
jgi:tRNA(fMet)-specific endonuclease VapC